MTTALFPLSSRAEQHHPINLWKKSPKLYNPFLQPCHSNHSATVKIFCQNSSNLGFFPFWERYRCLCRLICHQFWYVLDFRSYTRGANYVAKCVYFRYHGPKTKEERDTGHLEEADRWALKHPRRSWGQRISQGARCAAWCMFWVTTNMGYY